MRGCDDRTAPAGATAATASSAPAGATDTGAAADRVTGCEDPAAPAGAGDTSAALGATGSYDAPPAPAGATGCADETLPIAEAASIDELPEVLSSTDWGALEGRLEWSPQHRKLILRSDGVTAFPRAPRREIANPGALRPRDLAGFVGQRRVVESLRVAARAAKRRGEALGHVLLSGPGGLGKTTLAGIIAHELGASLRQTIAAQIAEPHQLVSLVGVRGENRPRKRAQRAILFRHAKRDRLASAGPHTVSSTDHPGFNGSGLPYGRRRTLQRGSASS